MTTNTPSSKTRDRTSGWRALSLLSDLELLERKIAEIGTVVLVGIDPLTAYFGVGKVDAYRTTDLRGVMTPLAALAQKHELDSRDRGAICLASNHRPAARKES